MQENLPAKTPQELSDRSNCVGRWIYRVDAIDLKPLASKTAAVKVQVTKARTIFT